MLWFKKNPESRMNRALRLLKRLGNKKPKPDKFLNEPRVPVGSIDIDDEYSGDENDRQKD